ncbi:MAG: sugar ABC transporter ATP-binding protein, partial [Paracoccaceae bacterium]
IKKLHQKLGTTIVYVTHDQIEALTLSTRIAVMNDGLVQQLGTPREIYDTPANLFVATFMGSPAMNLMPIRLVGDSEGLFGEVTTGLDEVIRLKFPDPSAKLRSYEGQNITLGIRPEAITDPEGADRYAQNLVQFTNRVIVTEPAGSDTFVMTTMGGKDCNARMRADAQVQAGQDVTFVINMDKAVPFDPKTENRIA